MGTPRETELALGLQKTPETACLRRKKRKIEIRQKPAKVAAFCFARD